ncbi:MAG: lipid A deacylase LpxR family protein [Micavibrio sp.]
MLYIKPEMPSGFLRILPRLMLMAGFFILAPAFAATAQTQPERVQSEPRPAALPPQEEAIRALEKSPYENFLSLSYENDLIGDGADKYYTSGVRMTYYNVNTPVPPVIEDIAELLPSVETNATTSTFFTLGQNLYTPSDIEDPNARPDDRPWAAWLYGSIGLTTMTNNHLDEFELTLGVVGPEALGEQTQKLIHRHITDSPLPKGWRHQLDFEPGLILSWQRRWPRGLGGDWHLDFGDSLRLRAEPNVNISLGNIYTYAGTGLMLTFGPGQEILQDTPPRVKPAMAGSGVFTVPDRKWGWYVFAGLDGRAVARNIFLDGNSFDSGSPSVDKKFLVGDAVAGLAFTFYDYRLSYTANYRTKEFDGQKEDTIFGSLTLTTRF